MSETTAEELELKKAQIELEVAKTNARGQRIQLIIAIVGLLTGLAALWAALSTRQKSEAAYKATSVAVDKINTAQKNQHEQVEEIREYAITISSASIAVPVAPVPTPTSTRVSRPPSVASGAPASSTFVVRVESSAKPPPPAPPPPNVALPSPESF